MRLHQRYALVSRAKLRLSQAVLAEMSEHDITPTEMIGILLVLTQDAQRLALRYERHGDYEKKADESD